MENLDDILKSEPAAEPTVEPTQEAEPIADEPRIEETPPRIRDEHGRFTKKDETGVETPQEPPAEQVPPTEQTGLPPAEFAALKDERRKRQELERRLEAMDAQLRQAPISPPAPPPDFWDDPAAFMTHMRAEMQKDLLQSLRQEQVVEKIDASEAAAKARHPDYDEAFAAFQQAVQYNPRLAQELARAPDPGEFCYSKGKAALAIEQHGSIDELLAAERQKWEAEVKGAVPTPRLVLPSTTAADGSVGARSGPEWAGPPSLNEIVGKKS